MPISTLLGRAWQTLAKTIPGFSPIAGERIVLFGARQVEESEIALLGQSGVQRIDTVEALRRALSNLSKKVEQIYVHVDLDVLDSREASANEWAGPNGISVKTLLEAIGEVSHCQTCALGIASYDPAVDCDGKALSVALSVIETLLKGL